MRPTLPTQNRLESTARFPIIHPRRRLLHNAVFTRLAFLPLLAVGCANHQNIYLDAHTLSGKSSYQHADSWAIFPEGVGDSRRVAAFQDKFPEIGAEDALQLPSGGLTARAYLYPAVAVSSAGSPPGTVPQGSASLIQKDLEKQKKAVMNSHPGIHPVFESQVATTVLDSPRNGHMIFFEHYDPATQQS